MLDKKDSSQGQYALLEGPQVTLTGTGLDLINRELKAEIDDLPAMPLTLALKTVLDMEAGSVWAVAIWTTTRRLLARAALFEMSDHPLVGGTVSMPMESSQPDEACLALIIESAKNDLRRTYGIGL